jgi:hypothetical protein
VADGARLDIDGTPWLTMRSNDRAEAALAAQYRLDRADVLAPDMRRPPLT